MSKNNHTSLLILLAIVAILIGGCTRVSSVKPLQFSHDDEMIRRGDFILLADRRVFAVMAFMNLCGYDYEYFGKEMYPARILVRKAMQEKAQDHAEALERWKKYYETITMGGFAYQDFALSLNNDYPFKRIRPDSELGYDYTAYMLADLPAVLNDFWKKLEMEQIWKQVKSDYLAELGKYDFDQMNKQLLFVWKYLKLQRRDNFVFVVVPNLLDGHYNAIGASYENYWYIVESPGSGGGPFNVHEYLHSIINPLGEANYDKHREKLDTYLEAGKDMPLGKSYRANITTFTSECLVRALAHRIGAVMTNDPKSMTISEKRINQLNKDGLTLVEPFYQSLGEYEDSGMNFEDFLPVMLERLDELSM